jgi:hypothetical protein
MGETLTILNWKQDRRNANWNVNLKLPLELEEMLKLVKRRECLKLKKSEGKRKKEHHGEPEPELGSQPRRRHAEVDSEEGKPIFEMSFAL